MSALAIGLGALWLAVASAAYGLFGVSLGFPFSDVRGWPLLGSLASFAIAAVWIFVWFAQLRILFDAARQELIVWTRGYFRSHERRISLAGCREVHMRHVHNGLASRTWRVSVEFLDGRSEHVTDIRSGIEPLAESLEAATKLPVKRYEYAA
jgi:hypothetical protein